MNAYYVSEGSVEECPSRYVATLKEAKMLQAQYSLMHSKVYGDLETADTFYITIEKVKLDTSKASILAMLNSEGGFEISSEEVA
tara:strand:- start:11103 stop:11354 length:252 start_codon:yes stop_codon:yes gene_type:complete